MLRISNLKVNVGDKRILQGTTLSLDRGEKVLLMGPNGSGKTTLARALLGDDRLKLVSGKITVENGGGIVDITNLSVSERAKRGIFVGFQSPVEIPGVGFNELMFFAYRELHENEEAALEIEDFYEKVEHVAQKLGLKRNLVDRCVNEGLSGGECKKMELLQMVILKPKYAILDEPDSGLDTDSIKIVGKAISMLDEKTGVLVISHDAKRLKVENFDRVLIIKGGKIAKEGGVELIEAVSEKGYGNI